MHNELVNEKVHFLNKKSKSLHFHELQDLWACQGSPQPIILDFGSTKLLKWIQEEIQHQFGELVFLKSQHLKQIKTWF